MSRLWRDEPAAIIGVGSAVISGAPLFFHWLNGAQAGALVVVLNALGAVFTRSKVASVDALNALAESADT